MDQLTQHLMNALMLGGTYALLGIGLTLIFGIMRVVNFTHGELYTFGAYMMFAVASVFDLTAAMNRRNLVGAPGTREVEHQLRRWEKHLAPPAK